MKLQYFSHLMWRADLLEKTLMMGEIEGRKRRGQQRMRWLDGITDSRDKFEQTPRDSEGEGSLACCCSWGHKELATTYWLNNSSLFLPSTSKILSKVLRWGRMGLAWNNIRVLSLSVEEQSRQCWELLIIPKVLDGSKSWVGSKLKTSVFSAKWKECIP